MCYWRRSRIFHLWCDPLIPIHSSIPIRPNLAIRPVLRFLSVYWFRSVRPDYRQQEEETLVLALIRDSIMIMIVEFRRMRLMVLMTIVELYL